MYDQLTGKYMDMRQKTMKTLALLNSGQNLIFSLGLMGVMALTAQGITQGRLIAALDNSGYRSTWSCGC